MADVMTFPDDWHDFLQHFSFVDSEEVYTNGSRLIPVFRVEQLIEHLLKAQEPKKPNRVRGRWFNSYHCGACGKFIGDFGGHRINFCYHCGQEVKWE